jgi:hypothetical protein
MNVEGSNGEVVATTEVNVDDLDSTPLMPFSERVSNEFFFHDSDEIEGYYGNRIPWIARISP